MNHEEIIRRRAMGEISSLERVDEPIKDEYQTTKFTREEREWLEEQKRKLSR